MSTGVWPPRREVRLCSASRPAMLVGNDAKEETAPASSCPRAAGGRLLSSMLIVGIAAAEVEGMLASGLGPALPEDPRCPVCGEQLRGLWRGDRRAVRLGRRVERLWIGRSRCRSCRRTHALLPSFVVPRRLDAAPVIGAALEQPPPGVAERRCVGSSRGSRSRDTPAGSARRAPDASSRSTNTRSQAA